MAQQKKSTAQKRKDANRHPITAHLPPDIIEAVRALANAERRSVSNLVEVAVLEYVRRHGHRIQIAQEYGSHAEEVASENVPGETPTPTDYYIPTRVGGHEVYLRLSQSGAMELLPAEKVDVDPASRTAAPPLPGGWPCELRWKGRPLSVQDAARLMHAEVAYTRATIRR